MTNEIELCSIRKSLERRFWPIGFIVGCVILPFTTGIDNFFWLFVTFSAGVYLILYAWNQDVYIKKDVLEVKSLFRTAFINISEVESISEPSDFGIIKITLRSQSKFGKMIRFYVKGTKRMFKQPEVAKETVAALLDIKSRVESAV